MSYPDDLQFDENEWRIHFWNQYNLFLVVNTHGQWWLIRHDARVPIGEASPEEFRAACDRVGYDHPHSKHRGQQGAA